MILLSLIALLSFAMHQSADEQRSLVRCVCGRVVFEHQGKKASSPPKATPARQVPVVLYERQDGRQCCKGFFAVASLETRRSGEFEFKGLRSGPYWLVVRANGHDAAVPIKYEPMKDYSPSTSVYTFAVTDAGDLNLEVTVTVD